jgi:hypothetical protein
VQFTAGINGWLWEIRQSGTFITGQTRAYGEDTEQFAELALLWSTYAMGSVKIELVPN